MQDQSEVEAQPTAVQTSDEQPSEDEKPATSNSVPIEQSAAAATSPKPSFIDKFPQLAQARDKLLEKVNPVLEKVQKRLEDPVEAAIATNVAVVVTILILGLILGALTQGILALVIQYGVFFSHGLPNKSEKFYDLSGSFTHLVVIISAMISNKIRSPRQIIAGVCGVVWLTRLGSFLYTRILRDKGDVRFEKVKQKAAPIFMVFWTLQALWVFIIQLPIILMNNIPEDTTSISIFDFVGFTMFCAGFAIELVADLEKFVFRSDPANRHTYITTGLWRLSRHPNYFGEILMWVGLSTVGFSVFSGLQFLAWLSPALTSFLLLRVSGVPLLHKASMKKWGSDPKYLHYIKHTNLLVLGKPAPPFDDVEKKD